MRTAPDVHPEVTSRTLNFLESLTTAGSDTAPTAHTGTPSWVAQGRQAEGTLVAPTPGANYTVTRGCSPRPNTTARGEGQPQPVPANGTDLAAQTTHASSLHFMSQDAPLSSLIDETAAGHGLGEDHELVMSIGRETRASTNLPPSLPGGIFRNTTSETAPVTSEVWAAMDSVTSLSAQPIPTNDPSAQTTHTPVPPSTNPPVTPTPDNLADGTPAESTPDGSHAIAIDGGARDGTAENPVSLGSIGQAEASEITGESLGAGAENEAPCGICLESMVTSTFLSCMHGFCLLCIQTYFRVNSGNGESRCPTCRSEISDQVRLDVLARHCDDPRSIQLEEGAREARRVANAQEEEVDRTTLTITFVRGEDDEEAGRNDREIAEGGDRRIGRYEEEVSAGWADLLGEEPIRPSSEPEAWRARRRRDGRRTGSSSRPTDSSTTRG